MPSSSIVYSSIFYILHVVQSPLSSVVHNCPCTISQLMFVEKLVFLGVPFSSHMAPLSLQHVLLAIVLPRFSHN